MPTDITPQYEIVAMKYKVIADDVEFGFRMGGLQANATSVQQGSGNSIFKMSESGIHLGAAEFADAPFRVTMAGALHATSGTFSGDITGATGTFSGTVAVGSLNIPNATSTNSFHVDSNGNMWLGAALFADGPFRVTNAGAVTATSATITGALTTGALSSIDGQYLTAASVASASANLALRGWTQTSAFSVTDADTVAWGAGTFTASDGTAYSIGASNTGNMTVRTYIYLDIAVSTTAYQTTTTAATAVGNGKVLIATAINGTNEATFQVFNGVGGLNISGLDIALLSITAGEIANTTITAGKIAANTITASQIAAGTITTTEIAATTIVAGNIAAGTITGTQIAASTITAGLISVANLAAINADMGAITAGSISVVAGANTIGLTPSGANAIFSGTTGSPEFKVTPAGAVIASNITITGGSISSTPISSIPNNTSTDISILEKTWTMVFSVTDADTIAWGAGTITLSNGRTFTIDAGNTGNMAALTYVYLDTGVSSTVLQTTTTAATALGANKILIGVAQNNTVTANWIPYGPGQLFVDGAQIGALSIVAGNIAASTITSGKLSVSQLSAITADMGAITAGSIVMPSGGLIRSGQTAYDTGTGFYLGNDVGTPKLSVGNSSGDKMTWDGSTLSIVGDLLVQGSFTAGEGIAAGNAIVFGDNTTYVRMIDQNNTGSDETFGTALNEEIAQSFQLSAGFAVRRARLRIKKVNAPTDDLTVWIKADSGDAPSGADLATATISNADITTAYQQFTVTLSATVDVAASTRYWVGVRRAGALNDTDNYRLDTAVSNPYADGRVLTLDGTTWSTTNLNGVNPDADFEILMLLENTRVYRASAATAGESSQFIGFAPSAILAAASGNIDVLGTSTANSGLTAGRLYFLSDTRGAISTTAGTVSKKVGLSISTTQLVIIQT